jgi:hypothetical protein
MLIKFHKWYNERSTTGGTAMLYLVFAMLLVIGVCAFLFNGKNIPDIKPRPAATSTALASDQDLMTTRNLKPLTRQEIKGLLERLAERPAPSVLSLGAKCYEVASPPARAEYLCPACGERTFYAQPQKNGAIDGTPRFVQWELQECRRLIKSLKGAGMTIDESEFCRKCTPGKKTPALVLVVAYKGEDKPQRTRGVNAGDIRMLIEFLNDQDRHKGERDSETPLKDSIPRMKELLGIKP